MNENKLNCLEVGQNARICNLLTNDSMRRRLQDIGFIEGANVECVRKGPSGDPIAYLIKGAVIALRNEDSLKILVALT